MDIILKGTLPDQIKYQGRCNHCTTVFTFVAKEAKLTYDQRDGDFFEVACPLPGCGRTVYVQRATVNEAANHPVWPLCR